MSTTNNPRNQINRTFGLLLIGLISLVILPSSSGNGPTRSDLTNKDSSSKLTGQPVLASANTAEDTTPNTAIKIEEAQRALQQRYQIINGKDSRLSWPDKSDGTKEEDFPNDGFYGEDRFEPSKAVLLVKNLANQLRSPGFLEKFVDREDGSIEGLETIPVHNANDLPLSSDIDASNYVEMFSRLTEKICKLKYILVKAKQVSQEAKGSYAYYLECSIGKSLALSAFQDTAWGTLRKFSYNEPTCQPPEGCVSETSVGRPISNFFATNFVPGFPIGAGAFAVRGKIQADLSTFMAGAAKLYMKLVGDDTYGGTVPVSVGPNKYGYYVDANVGRVWTSDYIAKAELTPVDNGDPCTGGAFRHALGWLIADQVVIVTPEFNPQNDIQDCCPNGGAESSQQASELIVSPKYNPEAENKVCKKEALTLTGLEVTQGIQDLTNSVVLIEERPTFVLAHVKSTSGTVTSAKAKLFGKRGDTKLPKSPLSPIGESITVSPTPKRKVIKNSFLYKLPKEWLKGNVELEFRGNGSSFQCKDQVNNRKDCKANPKFKKAAAVEVTLIGIEWKDGQGKPHAPKYPDFISAQTEIMLTFPIPNSNKVQVGTRGSGNNLTLRYLETGFVGPPITGDQFQEIAQRLQMLRSADGCESPSCKRYYFGVLVDFPTLLGGWAGGSPIESDVGAGYAHMDYTIPHELGHAAGVGHILCSQEDGPYEQAPFTGGKINPSGGTDFLGFDILSGQIFHPDSPFDLGDLMSDCRPGWVSQFTYEKIKAKLDVRYGVSSQLSLASKGVMAVDKAITISGDISRNEGTGQIKSVYTFNFPASAQLPDPGAYAIQFQNNQGQVLSTYSFEPEKSSRGSAESFSLALPWNANTKRIVLLHNNQELDFRSATANAPTVTVTYPNGGEFLNGSTATLRWSASDSDSDALKYTIQYSIDAGLTWGTLQVDWPVDTYELNLEGVSGTNQGLLRVLASDGFYTSEGQSAATFRVAGHAPELNIETPNNRFYVGDEIIFLDGRADDNEDGFLDDPSLTWSSNLNGILGSGRHLEINASTLAEGTHILTLTAKDSDGQTNSTNITIRVFRTRPVFPPSLLVEPTELSFMATVGSGQTGANEIAISNGGDGSLHWSASADQSWIRLSTASGAEDENISITADATGLPSGQYTGHITITTSDAPNSPQTVVVIFVVVEPLISINDVSIVEGNSGLKTMAFTVTLSLASDLTVNVNFATANGTATAPADYLATNGTLTFNPGDLTKTISVTIDGDQSFEPDETFLVNLSNAVNASINDNQGTGTILNDDAQGGIINFSQANYTVAEEGGSVTVTVSRTGDTSGPATVDYATPDDSSATMFLPCVAVTRFASPRCDFTTGLGTLRFAPGEISKTFTVLISQDNFVEGPEMLPLTLSNLTGGAVFGVPSTATLTITDDLTEPPANSIDDTRNFIRQLYHDLLNREPDAGGFTFWVNEIDDCTPKPQCIESKRVSVAEAFLSSIEFQESGYYVYLMNKAGFGDINPPSVPVPIRFTEFIPNVAEVNKGVIVGQGDWRNQLDLNKMAYALAFVKRPEFLLRYPGIASATALISLLDANAGGTLSDSERTALITTLSHNPADSTLRAEVLMRIAENQVLRQREFNRASILIEYFVYLRRNPDAAPDADFTGYNFWLTKLNQFNGDYLKAEMSKAYIRSIEYRQRFGPN